MLNFGNNIAFHWMILSSPSPRTNFWAQYLGVLGWVRAVGLPSGTLSRPGWLCTLDVSLWRPPVATERLEGQDQHGSHSGWGCGGVVVRSVQYVMQKVECVNIGRFFSRRNCDTKWLHLRLQHLSLPLPTPELARELRWPAQTNPDTSSTFFFGGLVEGASVHRVHTLILASIGFILSFSKYYTLDLSDSAMRRPQKQYLC